MKTLFTQIPRKKSAEIADPSSGRDFGCPDPHVFGFTFRLTAGQAKSTPVLPSIAGRKRFGPIFFAKQGFLLATLTLGASANAGISKCIDPTTADHGYAAEISADRSTATVSRVNMAGVSELTTLACAHLQVDALTAAPGTDVLACREPGMADHGFKLVVKSVDCAGKLHARIEEESVAGPRALAELVCTVMSEPIPAR